MGQEAVEMACELAMEHKTLQLSAIIPLLYDLVEPARNAGMAIGENSYPHLQLPPKVDCSRYDQLTMSSRETCEARKLAIKEGEAA